MSIKYLTTKSCSLDNLFITVSLKIDNPLKIQKLKTIV